MHQDIKTELKNDLKPFADPGSDVEITSEHVVQWTQGGKNRSLQIAPDPETQVVVIEDDRRLSWRGFLASASMASLLDFSRISYAATPDTEHYIATAATEVDADLSSDDAVELLLSLTRQPPSRFSTRLLFVRGEAGAGKTVALRQLTKRAARDYMSGTNGPLFLYVDAQGRALSRLEDAMAKELQDLRAAFTYEAVETLARHHLLIPIIDGFDELLGSGGYDDAYSSLAAFIAKLNGKGVVVASARSSFIDYQGFREKADRLKSQGSLSYHLDWVDVNPWSTDTTREYFCRHGAEYEAQYDELQNRLPREQFELLAKPFFASEVVRLLKDNSKLATADSLLAGLAESFLAREVEKLKDRQGQPLLPIEGHRKFIAEVAEEMWWNENQALDVGAVQTIAELVAEESNSPAKTAAALAEKAASYAFLTTSGDSGLRFQHEVYLDYFVALHLRDLIRSGSTTELRRFLSRAPLGEVTAADVASALVTEQDLTRTLDTIVSCSATGVFDVLLRENCGALVRELLARSPAPLEGLTIKNLVVRGGTFGASALASSSFVAVELHEVDATDIHWQKCNFERCLLRDVLISTERTNLEGSRLRPGHEVMGIRYHVGDDLVVTRDPSEMRSILSGLGVPDLSPENGEANETVDRELRDGLEKVLRVFERQYYVDKDEWQHKGVMSGRRGETVLRVLRDLGLLESKTVSRSGPTGQLERLVVPPRIIREGEGSKSSRTPSEVVELWRKLREFS